MPDFDPYYKWLGIPADEQPPNHYRLLGIRLFEPDCDVIDAAANRQMAYLQQCATGPHAEDSQKLLNELSATRVCLLSAASKSEYDAELMRSLPSPVHVEFAEGGQRSRFTVVSVTTILIALVAGILVVVSNRAPRATGQSDAISLVGSRIPPSLPDNAGALKKPATNPPRERQIHFQARIDGQDELRVYYTVANWVHRDGLWPRDAELNGMAWSPKTTPEIPNAGETRYLDADADFLKATLEIVRGRGSVVFRRFADSVYVNFNDPESGGDTYEIILHIPIAGETPQQDAAQAKTYLSDMGPLRVRVFTNANWGFGGQGHLGSNTSRSISVAGVAARHGLGAHPPKQGQSLIEYQLGKNYKRLSGKVALDDSAKSPGSDLTFKILGDRKELWKSSPITKVRRSENFDVDVSGVDRLTLIANCSGRHEEVHAVWVDPVLTQAAGPIDRPEWKVGESQIWRRGMGPIPLLERGPGFCVLTEISGEFLGGG
ncbi:MAG TPA: NPCBM/NEW2 domain-containing protein, partial [Planctomycetaceae bacterium]